MLHCVFVAMDWENTTNNIVTIHWECRSARGNLKLTFYRRGVTAESSSNLVLCKPSPLFQTILRTIEGKSWIQPVQTHRQDQADKDSWHLHPLSCLFVGLLWIFTGLCKFFQSSLLPSFEHQNTLHHRERERGCSFLVLFEDCLSSLFYGTCVFSTLWSWHQIFSKF